MHLFVMLVYAGTLRLIDQVISGAWLLSFNFHICFDSVVLLMYFRLLNDNLCVASLLPCPFCKSYICFFSGSVAVLTLTS